MVQSSWSTCPPGLSPLYLLNRPSWLKRHYMCNQRNHRREDGRQAIRATFVTITRGKGKYEGERRKVIVQGVVVGGGHGDGEVMSRKQHVRETLEMDKNRPTDHRRPRVRITPGPRGGRGTESKDHTLRWGIAQPPAPLSPTTRWDASLHFLHPPPDLSGSLLHTAWWCSGATSARAFTQLAIWLTFCPRQGQRRAVQSSAPPRWGPRGRKRLPAGPPHQRRSCAGYGA